MLCIVYVYQLCSCLFCYGFFSNKFCSHHSSTLSVGIVHTFGKWICEPPNKYHKVLWYSEIAVLFSTTMKCVLQTLSGCSVVVVCCLVCWLNFLNFCVARAGQPTSDFTNLYINALAGNTCSLLNTLVYRLCWNLKHKNLLMATSARHPLCLLTGCVWEVGPYHFSNEWVYSLRMCVLYLFILLFAW